MQGYKTTKLSGSTTDVLIVQILRQHIRVTAAAVKLLSYFYCEAVNVKPHSTSEHTHAVYSQPKLNTAHARH